MSDVALSSRASEYSIRGYQAERDFWTNIAPMLFRERDGYVVEYNGKRGQVDAKIRHGDTTYLCDSKDYAVPLEDRNMWIQLKKLEPEFREYMNEIKTSPSTKIVALVHEVNRNLWFTVRVRNPLTCMRNEKGQLTGSIKVDLENPIQKLDRDTDLEKLVFLGLHFPPRRLNTFLTLLLKQGERRLHRYLRVLKAVGIRLEEGNAALE